MLVHLYNFFISIETLKQVQGDNSDYFQYPESSSGQASLKSLELPTFILSYLFIR